MTKAPIDRYKDLLRLSVLVLLVLAARSSLADHYEIPSGSMKPSLQVGDHVLVDKTAYGIRLPFSNWYLLDFASPQAGQVVFLRRRYGSMRYGNDVIRIGPGANAHHMWEMRDAETAPGHVRVLLTFRTPVDHAFTLQCYHSPTSIGLL